MRGSKKSVFGIVFLTIFLDMVGFSIIFPLFPAMLDHYLFLEQSMGGGIVSSFVSWVSGFANQASINSPSFRLETVIFGGVLGSLYAALQFVFAPIWGGLSDRYGRKPILLFTLLGTALGYFLWIMSGNFGSWFFPGWLEEWREEIYRWPQQRSLMLLPAKSVPKEWHLLGLHLALVLYWVQQLVGWLLSGIGRVLNWFSLACTPFLLQLP